MRTEEEVRARIAELEDIKNTVFNQVTDGKMRGELEDRIATLRWVLNEPAPSQPVKPAKRRR